MKYDAITIDTNIFSKNGYNLESGLLGQLTQFKEGSVTFILSEIVLRELKRHLIRDGKKMRSEFDRLIKDAQKSLLLSEGLLETFKDKIAVENDPEKSVESRLSSFLENTGAIIIEAKRASMEDVVNSYFDALAPFEDTGKKKNEFPDAIALLSIKNWAEQNNNKVLVVSDDKGWLDFARGKKWLSVESDLTKALSLIQKHTELASIASKFVEKLYLGEDVENLGRIEEDIRYSVASLNIYAEANSWLRCEAEFTDLELTSFSFKGDQEFTILRVGSDLIVIEVPILIEAHATAIFSFYAWDSIDKEEIPMGNAPAVEDVVFDAAILITLSLDTTLIPYDVDVTEIELIKFIDTVDFGEVEPDFSDDDYER